MKKANMNINFENDTATFLGEHVNLVTTNSGHLALPLTKNRRILNDISIGEEMKVTLTSTQQKLTHEIAVKLHRQFTHAQPNKLHNLLDSAGKPWSSNKELKDEITKVSHECRTCLVYQKVLTRPVVGLPMASKFQECVAMDLKFYAGHILLHLVDHETRLSASCVLPNKKPDTIISAVLRIWISVYGSCEKFLTGNGGEFANEEFLELSESFNIYVKVTAAESPFSNGLVERHNLTISEMLNKVIEDTECDISVALTWCLNAKNLLKNVHGFSPYQLAIGHNP